MGVQAQDLPRFADPGRVEQNETPLPRPDEQLKPKIATQKATSNIPPGAETHFFVLKDLHIHGMTAFSEQDVRPIYASLLNQKISLADLYKIRAALQQKYNDAGFSLTEILIPDQKIDDGIIDLNVIEGYVTEVELADNLRHDPLIDDVIARIYAMHPLNTLELERLLLILNDFPDADFSVILARPHDANATSGQVRLILQQNAAHGPTGSASINNNGSAFAGPVQGTIRNSFAGIGLPYSQLDVFASATSPLAEQRYASVRYTVPIFGVSGAQVFAETSRAWTRPGSSLHDLDVEGASRSMTVGLSYGVIKQRDKVCVADVSFEHHDSQTDLLGDEFSDDRLRVVQTGVSYNFSDNLNGYNLVDLHYARGLDMMGVREKGSVDLSRAEGDPVFNKVTMSASRTQILPLHFEFFGLMSGQYADRPLLSSEEFGFGGDQLGRGYDSSEITGDRGMAFSAEIRRHYSLALSDIQIGLEPYGFYDFGKVWNIDPHDKNKISAASTGMGIRMDVGDRWSANASMAFPLTKPAENRPKYSDQYGPRILLSVGRSF